MTKLQWCLQVTAAWLLFNAAHQAEAAQHIEESLEELAVLGLTEHPEEARLQWQQQHQLQPGGKGAQDAEVAHPARASTTPGATEAGATQEASTVSTQGAPAAKASQSASAPQDAAHPVAPDSSKVLAAGSSGLASAAPAPISAPTSLWSAVFGTRYAELSGQTPAV